MVRLRNIAENIPQLAGELLPVIKKGFEDEDFDVRERAMKAISSIVETAPRLFGNPQPMLRMECDDEDVDVRQSAMETIGNIVKAAPHLSGDLLRFDLDFYSCDGYAITVTAPRTGQAVRCLT